jgi:peptide/nickel transport system permease protein
MLGVSFIVFSILHIAPGDPATILAGDDATAADIATIEARYGLDRPFLVQYGIWLGRVVQGDLGRSIVTRRPVTTEIRARIPHTAELAVAAILFAIVLGAIVGLISATRHNTAVDYLTMVIALIGVSMPVFWLGLILIFFFSVDLGWLPTGGAGSWQALILPAIALGASSTAIVARMMRSSVLETIRQDYIRTARAKGLAERAVLSRHLIKNALIPVVTVIGIEFGYLLGGTVVTETVFARPGLGRLLVDGIQTRDFPVVQGTLMFLATVFVLVNLTVDIFYSFLDPRIRNIG